MHTSLTVQVAHMTWHDPIHAFGAFVTAAFLWVRAGAVVVSGCDDQLGLS